MGGLVIIIMSYRVVKTCSLVNSFFRQSEPFIVSQVSLVKCLTAVLVQAILYDIVFVLSLNGAVLQ